MSRNDGADVVWREGGVELITDGISRMVRGGVNMSWTIWSFVSLHSCKGIGSVCCNLQIWTYLLRFFFHFPLIWTLLFLLVILELFKVSFDLLLLSIDLNRLSGGENVETNVLRLFPQFKCVINFGISRSAASSDKYPYLSLIIVFRDLSEWLVKILIRNLSLCAKLLHSYSAMQKKTGLTESPQNWRRVTPI